MASKLWTDLTLQVRLELPDKDFPKLAANPIFRPVFWRRFQISSSPNLDADTITNGPFKISKIGGDGITMERSDNYWDQKALRWNACGFVAANSAEAALDAYKKGEVDVVTNAAFEPLALKLLAPV